MWHITSEITDEMTKKSNREILSKYLQQLVEKNKIWEWTARH